LGCLLPMVLAGLGGRNSHRPGHSATNWEPIRGTVEAITGKLIITASEYQSDAKEKAARNVVRRGLPLPMLLV
jgi:hypothetical protein